MIDYTFLPVITLSLFDRFFENYSNVKFDENPSSWSGVVPCVTAVKVSNFSGHYLRNRSTLDIGVLGYIGIV